MKPVARLSAAALAIPATGAALGHVGPWPIRLTATLIATLTDPAQAAVSGGADAIVLPCALAVCWLGLLWFAAIVVSAALGVLPGLIGSGARAVCLAITPRLLQRVALGTLSATLATSAVSAGTSAMAFAADSRPAPVAAPSLDWPTDRVMPPHSATPTRHPMPKSAVPGRHRPTSPGAVTVRHGDTLWALAANHLGPSATNQDIAVEWPRWWSANRDVIGPDPHLIRPGQRLRVPGLSTTPGEAS
jgi:hypothetical protein